jgi:hypothetical protein
MEPVSAPAAGAPTSSTLPLTAVVAMTMPTFLPSTAMTSSSSSGLHDGVAHGDLR